MMDSDQSGAQARLPDRSPARNWVSLALYALAFLVLAGGVLLGLSLTNAAALVPAASSGFQSATVKPLWDTWQDGLRLFGIIELAVSVLISGLLLTCGLLWARQAELAGRLALLEGAAVSAGATTPGHSPEGMPGVYSAEYLPLERG